MREITVNANDCKAVEVRHNNSIQFEMGSCSEAYKTLCEKERQIIHQLTDVIFAEKWSGLIALMLTARNYKDDKAEIDLETVLRKVTSLMVEGFHSKVVRGMLRCGSGGGVDNSEFQEKFEAAMDKEIRKDFWGTESRFPLYVAEHLLEDLEAGINISKPKKNELKKSALMRQMVDEKKLKAFLANY